MIGPTFGIACFFVLLALSRRSAGAAVGVLVMSMLVWPEYLRVPLGIVQMSVPRFVALALLIKLIGQGKHRQIIFGRVDILVLLVWIWTILATAIADAAGTQLTQVIGSGLDTVLIYFVARMCILSHRDVQGIYYWAGYAAIIMGVLGSLEAATSRSPYQELIAYRGWSWFDKDSEYRLGFLRAQGSTSVSIYFGMAMMTLTGLLFSMRGYVAGLAKYKLIIIVSILGVLSSMSSGPWAAIFLLMALCFFEKRINYIKPALALILLAAVSLEIASNRHFYQLIDYISLDSSNAWYRSRLLEVAISQIHDYWLFGVGSNWPHHWGMLIDGRAHVDVVNNFLIISLYGGLVALIMFVASHLFAIKLASAAWRNNFDPPRRKIIFRLCATLIALDVSSMSVGLFGPPLILSYVLLGVLVSVSVAWVSNEAEYIDVKRSAAT